VITELEDNTFGDITFKQITLDSPNLRRIAPNSFATHNTLTVEKVQQIYNSQLGDSSQYTKQFFTALNSLLNVSQIRFIGSNLTTIPSNAFSLLKGELNLLKEIEFYDTTLKSI
jgi:hypothetical protein